jgi:hypothetical protein
MAVFLALYEGDTVSSARLIAVSMDSELVREFATRVLDWELEEAANPAGREVELGRRRALKVVRDGD